MRPRGFTRSTLAASAYLIPSLPVINATGLVGRRMFRLLLNSANKAKMRSENRASFVLPYA